VVETQHVFANENPTLRVGVDYISGFCQWNISDALHLCSLDFFVHFPSKMMHSTKNIKN
jgi:hypothetical protein